MKKILVIDEGTTGVTVQVVSDQLKVLAEKSEDFKQFYPQNGWVEHDLDLIWNAVQNCIRSTTRGHQVDCIGITNQRETLCFWDSQTLKPLCRAIVWQDRRSAKLCESLKRKGLEKKFTAKTGLLLDPYFSGTKLSWALKHIPKVKKAFQQKRLRVGTIDSFLIAKLTHGASYVTEPSNASRTLLYNIHTHQWDLELCKVLQIPSSLLPEVKTSAGNFGFTQSLSCLPSGIPITGVLGDQQSALLGQLCTEKGQAKCTYGTGAFLLMNTGSKAYKSSHKLLTTIAWEIEKNKVCYALEGSTFIAGAAVQWFKEGLALIQSSKEIETLASQVKDTDGVVFVPALTGLGAPYWNPHARGAFMGLTRGTTRAHLARALLEGIAFQIRDVLECMNKDLKGKAKLTSLNVDGGASMNTLLMQFQSDLLNVTLKRPTNIETTSMGAALIAGLGHQIWPSLKSLKKSMKIDKVFKPQMLPKLRNHKIGQWERSVSSV